MTNKLAQKSRKLWLSHDSFIFLCIIYAKGGKAFLHELEGYAHYSRKKSLDTVIFELVISKRVTFHAREMLIEACSKQFTKSKTNCFEVLNSFALKHIDLHQNALTPQKSYLNRSLYTADQNACDSIDFKSHLSTAVRGCHAGYQAVVQGKQAKKSAINKFQQQLARQDLKHYWQLIEEYEDAHGSGKINRQLARLTD